MEQVLDPVSEEAHLREIWRELGVGASGYIALHELALVCEHIGMDEMSDEVSDKMSDEVSDEMSGEVSDEMSDEVSDVINQMVLLGAVAPV